MLFEKLKTFYSFPIRGVLHVGASVGEELVFYKNHLVQKLIYIEANQVVFNFLEKRARESKSDSFDVKSFCFAAFSEEKELEFNVASNLKSSSLHKMKEHLDQYPTIQEVCTIKVKGKRLDQAIPADDLEKINTVVLDIQGGELNALKGLSSILGSQIDAIITEVNSSHLYEGIPLIGDLDTYLATFGFTRYDTMFNAPSWGDALYLRK